ncbi:type II secretion system protein [Tissierella creatinini]|nr:type II secretion system protein [Tissierella creatinini]TJX69071.1 type II secretion system protein [Soehngenia saccharolytica]
MNEKFKLKRETDNRGMTLIEVLLSLAIVGIIAISLLPMFSNGIKFLVNNGNQIKAMYEGQDLIEQEISKAATSEENTMSVVFPGKTIEIKGKDYTISNYNLFITKK